MAKKVGISKKRKFSALVVDDDATCRAVHVAFLSRNEFETYTVENGREAVDLIRSGEYFDVIFMDLMMPVLNGIQATRELRSMGVKSMIVGIDCSPNFLGEDFMQAGIDLFYEKPMTHEIAISVRQALENDYNMY